MLTRKVWRSPFAVSEDRNYGPEQLGPHMWHVALTVRGEREPQPRPAAALSVNRSPALAQASKELVERWLADPGLTAAMLAHELHVSVRTLRKALASVRESVAACIGQRRGSGVGRANQRR
jgi:hypothetical protein